MHRSSSTEARTNRKSDYQAIFKSSERNTSGIRQKRRRLLSHMMPLCKTVIFCLSIFFLLNLIVGIEIPLNLSLIKITENFTAQKYLSHLSSPFMTANNLQHISVRILSCKNQGALS